MIISSISPEQRTALHSRFWSACDMSKGPYSCWHWKHARGPRGYGKFKFEGRSYAAHRVSFCISTNCDISTESICHSCDVPSCVNPSHLWSGTHQDNMADMARKKRSSGSTTFRVTADMAQQMLALCKQGQSQSDVARKYEVSRSTVYDIVHGRYKWRDL